MFTKQYCGNLSALLLPKGAAPTTTCLVPALPSKRLRGKQSASIYPQARSGTYYRSLPDQPGHATPIRSTPKNPTQTHRLRSSANEESAQSLPLQGGGLKSSNPILKCWNVFVRFSRLYACIANAVAVSSVSFLPVASVAELTPSFFQGFAQAFTVCMLMGIYNSVVNQVYDVDIDRINKPYLPLVTGEISMTAATILMAALVAVSLMVALMSRSPALTTFVVIGFFLGTAYSAKLPLLRWKSNPFLSPLFIVGWGGLLLQLAFFWHIQVYVLNKRMIFTRPVIFSTAIMSLLCFIVTLAKDIPDVEGDKADGVQTFAIWFGQERVFNVCVGSLMVAYAICMGVGVASTNVVCRTVSVLGHGILAAVYWLFSRNVDLKSSDSVAKYYMLIWKLMYAEYVLIHFVR